MGGLDRALVGENNPTNQGTEVPQIIKPAGLMISVSHTRGVGTVGSFGFSMAITGNGIGIWNNLGAGCGIEGANTSVVISPLLQFEDFHNLIKLSDIDGSGLQYNLGYNIYAFGLSYNTRNSISVKPISFVAPSFGMSSSAELPFKTLSGSIQSTYSKRLFSISFGNGK
jgi:hypothetical protein